MNLRLDTLSQMLNQCNVQSGGRYLVYETGCMGLVVAAALERLGGKGKVIHIYETGNPCTQAMNSMNFGKDELENCLGTMCMYHVRSLEQGEDLLANHPARDTSDPNVKV